MKLENAQGHRTCTGPPGVQGHYDIPPLQLCEESVEQFVFFQANWWNNIVTVTNEPHTLTAEMLSDLLSTLFPLDMSPLCCFTQNWMQDFSTV